MRSIIFALLAFLVVGQASAGTVHGIVYPGRTQSRELPHRDECFWRLGPDIRPSTAASPLFVVLEGEGAHKAKPPSASPPTILIEGYELQPPVISVPVGSTLTFKNFSPRTQSCFAKGPSGFQFSDLKTGGTHEHRFLSGGTVEVSCHLYPFMRATIVVTESPLVTKVDRSGRFSFQKVPVGKYNAKVFAHGSWRWTLEVNIPSSGLVQVDLGPNVAAVTPQKVVEEERPPEEKPVVEVKKIPGEESFPEKKMPPRVKKPPRDKKTPPRKYKEAAQPIFKDVEPVIEPEKKPAEKKKPAEEKKPPPRKPKEATEPMFKDVELEIEIEE